MNESFTSGRLFHVYYKILTRKDIVYAVLFFALHLDFFVIGLFRAAGQLPSYLLIHCSSVSSCLPLPSAERLGCLATH